MQTYADHCVHNVLTEYEDINSCVYALIQLSGHSPKTVSLYFFLPPNS